ncbi:MAG TPA: ATP-dependent Clp protease adaptor ClpS [Polyangiaceae bacterium]
MRSKAPAYTAVTTAPPEVETRPEVSPQHEVLPPWKVILHNDDHNDMVYVVQCLVKSVPKLGRARAVEIMFEAHNHGHALVCTCPLELAELYRDRLESFGLTATIEKA